MCHQKISNTHTHTHTHTHTLSEAIQVEKEMIKWFGSMQRNKVPGISDVWVNIQVFKQNLKFP
jgi:hypothetical protein